MMVGKHLHRLLLQAPPPPTVARVASLAEAEATADAANPAEDAAAVAAAALRGLHPAGMDRPTIHPGVDTEAMVDMEAQVMEDGVDMEAMVDKDRGVALALVITPIPLVNGYTSRHPAARLQVAHMIARAASQDPRVVRLVDAASLVEDAVLHLLPVPMTVTTPGVDGVDTEDGADTTVIGPLRAGPHLAPGMAARVESLVLVEDPRAARAAAPRGLPPVGMDQHTIHPGVDTEDGATTEDGTHQAQTTLG